MKLYPDMQSKYLVWFLSTYWFVQIFIFQGLRITPECLENPLLIAEANDDIYLDSFSDSYLHPFPCGTFIGTEIILYLIVEYSSAKLWILVHMPFQASVWLVLKNRPEPADEEARNPSAGPQRGGRQPDVPRSFLQETFASCRYSTGLREGAEGS